MKLILVVPKLGSLKRLEKVNYPMLAWEVLQRGSFRSDGCKTEFKI